MTAPSPGDSEPWGYSLERKRGDREVIIVELHGEQFAVKQIETRFEKGQIIEIRLLTPEGIRPTNLQRLPWKTILDAADALDRRENHESPKHDKSRTKTPHESRGRPRDITDAYLIKIRDRYLQLKEDGESAPAAIIAEQEGKDASTIRGYIKRCRDKGWM